MKEPRSGDNPLQRFFGNTGIDDSAFDDFFSGTTEKSLLLRTELKNVHVLRLPAAGRPTDFSGAVGQFDVTTHAAPMKLTAGDPITLQLGVSGQGNFDRVNSHGLEGSAEWKTYPPKARFEPADNAGFSGTKTFEQAIIPLKTGQEQIPAVRFIYFDPDKGQYVTRTTTPIAIDVAAGSGASPAAAAMSAGPGNSTAQSSAIASAPELAPNKVEPGNFVASSARSSLRPGLLPYRAYR